MQITTLSELIIIAKMGNYFFYILTKLCPKIALNAKILMDQIFLD